MPRFLHRFYANVMGYFWLPCPLCGRMFGGHEHGAVSVPMPNGADRVACKRHRDGRVGSRAVILTDA